MTSRSSRPATPGPETGSIGTKHNSRPSSPSQLESDRIIITASGGLLPRVISKLTLKRDIPCPCGKMFTSYESMSTHRRAKAAGSNPCPDLPPEQVAVAAAAAADGTPLKSKRGKKRKEHAKFVSQLIEPNSQMVGAIGIARDVTPALESVTWRSEGHLACTYNWANSSDATILVPGGAPVWESPTPEQLPASIPKNTSLQFKDQNLARQPLHQWLPVFRAMDAMRQHHPSSPSLNHPLPGGHISPPIQPVTNNASSTPAVRPLQPLTNFLPVELLINRGSLQQLFNICLQVAQQPFALRVHSVGQKTLIFERCDRKSWTRPSGLDGYGPNFEHHFAQWPEGLEESASHHRVVRYRLGPLDCMVRCEVDVACQEEGTEVDAQKVVDDLQTDANEGLPDDEDCEDEQDAEVDAELDADLDTDLTAENDTPALQQQQVAETVVEDRQPLPASPSKTKKLTTRPANVMPRRSVLRVKLAGDASAAPLVPAELKSTVSNNYIGNARNHIPQLWFGRTPTIVMGHHDGSGNYSSVAIRNMASALDKWEKLEYNQKALRRLVGLIRAIRTMVRIKARSRPCILVWNGRPEGWIKGEHDVEFELWPCKTLPNEMPRHVLPYGVHQTWFPRAPTRGPRRAQPDRKGKQLR